MPDLSAIIANDYPGPGTDTDAQVLAWLQEPVTVPVDINFQELLMWASEQQIGKKLKAAIADEEATPGTWTAGIYNDLIVLDTMMKSGGDLALSRTDVRTLVSNLSGPAKPFSAANKNDLFARSDTSRLRLETYGFSQIDDASWLYHIAEARA